MPAPPNVLQEAYRALGGRMAQEAMRRHVLRVLRIWRLWSVFSDDFLNGLQARVPHRPLFWDASCAMRKSLVANPPCGGDPIITPVPTCLPAPAVACCALPVEGAPGS